MASRRDVNMVRNGRLACGGRAETTLRAWDWVGDNAADWRPAPALNGDPGGAAISTHRPASGLWRQRVRLKSEEFYRVEAVVSADCTGDEGGAVLAVTLFDASGSVVTRFATRPVQRATGVVLRGYFLRPKNATHAEIRVGLERGRGRVCIHEVRLLPIIEVDANGHPSATPPPAFELRPPTAVRRVCVVATQPDRPVVALLKTRFGSANVEVASPAKAKQSFARAQAVLLLDAKPPPGCRTLRELQALARERIVILALPCMAGISGDALETRTITQPDDPLHARIAFACYATAGFALHDIIPFFAGEHHDRTLWQRQFLNPSAARRFCRENGFEIFLDAETNRESTSDQPMALIRIQERGAIIAMDVEPIEAAPSSLDEPNLAAHLLLTALGGPKPMLGQFAAAPREPAELLGHVRDLVERFDGLYWLHGEKPRDAGDPYLVGVGPDLPSMGLALPPRPLILIRTCLSGDDICGVYGAAHLLRNLLRPPPYASPYAARLNSRYRLAWMPQSADFTPWGGWYPTSAPAVHELELEFEPGTAAACIDVASTPERHVRVIVPKRAPFGALLADALPSLAHALLAGRYVYLAGAPAGHGRDRSGLRWRVDDLALDVVRDDAPFREGVHRAVRAAGGSLVRVELPATSSEAMAQSIWLTDWAATLLELVIGLIYGLIVVNRDAAPLRLSLPPSINHLRRKLALRSFNTDSPEVPIRPGPRGTLVIPPAQALIACR